MSRLTWKFIVSASVGTLAVLATIPLCAHPLCAQNITGSTQADPPRAHVASVQDDGQEVQPGSASSIRLVSGTFVDESPVTRVTSNTNVLPNTAGQIWREYDIRPYTAQITTSERPEKAIVDWILRETGHEMWFQEPLGILNASKDTLRVYHTREVHSVIQPIVDRFVQSRGSIERVGVRLITVENPDWRSRGIQMMQPIDIGSPGVEGWVISKENAAILFDHLKRRSDFVQHQAGDVTLHNGQKISISRRRPIPFIQSIRWKNDPLAPFEPVAKTVNEGYDMDFSLLTGREGRTVETIVRCDVDQVEALRNVQVDVPLPNGTTKPIDLKVPQVVSWRLHERFRWPRDQVLILSCGVVANPAGQANGFMQLPNLFDQSKGRADALMFIEYKGSVPSR
jgi:hypothetical protein